MMIRHKGVEHNVFGDAPFVATRISAIGCSHRCPGCHHESLNESAEVYHESVADIINSVLSNPFDEGIVMGGLEWTEQPEEMMCLISEAKKAGLKVMLYTHWDKDDFIDMFGEPSGMYIKHGEFVAGDIPHKQYGVQLANRGQYIIFYEGGNTNGNDNPCEGEDDSKITCSCAY